MEQQTEDTRIGYVTEQQLNDFYNNNIPLKVEICKIRWDNDKLNLVPVNPPTSYIIEHQDLL